MTQFPFYQLYVRLGREFVTELHDLCDQYYRTRKAVRIVAINDLAVFICAHPAISAELLKSRSFMSKFWSEFFLHYVTTGYARDVAVSSLLRGWNNEFVFFAKTFLIGSGFLADSFGRFPCSAEGSYACPKKTNIKKDRDGYEVKTKLITHVPLQVSDQEAMEILFSRINEDIETTLKWARNSVASTWQRLQLREELASKGAVRAIGTTNQSNGGRWHIDHANPDFGANIAATFAHHGYQTANDQWLGGLYGKPLAVAAEILAIPTTGTLLPHCAVLVAVHPIITPSFLETNELYDARGNLTAYTTSAAGPVLIGYKDRNGPAKSRQEVQLTAETDEIVKQIIHLTRPLREYLKSRGDDNWRRLLLTSGCSFSYPRPIARLASDTSIPSRLVSLANDVKAVTRLTLAEAQDFAERFSLSALRASVGVSIYLRERNVRKMADALGHTEYRADLLSRYLPEPILAFFEERWVRLFQAGVIAQAMIGSPYVVVATGFKNMAELDNFLTNHALKPYPGAISAHANEVRKKPDLSKEILIAVDTHILMLLLAVIHAVNLSTRQPSGIAIFWAEFGEKVIAHIDSNECKRPDLKQYLSEAKAKEDRVELGELIYA